MNKASCLSLISNAVLAWNTIQIQKIVEEVRAAVPRQRQTARWRRRA